MLFFNPIVESLTQVKILCFSSWSQRGYFPPPLCDADQRMVGVKNLICIQLLRNPTPPWTSPFASLPTGALKWETWNGLQYTGVQYIMFLIRMSPAAIGYESLRCDVNISALCALLCRYWFQHPVTQQWSWSAMSDGKKEESQVNLLRLKVFYSRLILGIKAL